MIEYKYKKVKGLSEKKFLENGHTMFESDVLRRLQRLAHLEEQIKQGQLLPIDSVSQRSELLLAYTNFIQQPAIDGAYTHDEYIEMFLSQ